MTGLAKQAVEAALSAGAGDAEAYASEEGGREVRVHGGEVESLTAATQRGLGVRAWIGGRVGYAFGTDLSEAGIAAIGARAAQAAQVADEDEFAGPPKLPLRPIPGMPAKVAAERGVKLELTDSSVAEWSTARVAELALAIEKAAVATDPRVAGVEQAVYAESVDRVAIASSTGVEGEYEASSCYAYLQALAESGDGKETGLGFGLARGPAGLDPAAIGREGAERAVAMIGAGKPPSRTCPVVLDPTVAAGFAGLIGGTLGADAVQRGRSPFAERLGEEVAGEALALHDDGLDSGGLAASPFDGEGVPRRRTALIEGGRLRNFLYDTYTARRGDAESTANAGRGGYRVQPSVSLQPRGRARGALLRGVARRGRRRALRNRRSGAALRRQPGFRRLFGGRCGAADLRRRAGRAGARVHDRQRPGLDAARRARRRRGGPLGALRRLGQHAAVADRGDDGQRLLGPQARSPPSTLLDCGPSSIPRLDEEELRRD
ncbi:MAG TPA: TldD/PmbA family protein [Solirubrobacterales bacterium]|nr:TldD/PmbA family protein [Solirubrobacterales bacterium]